MTLLSWIRETAHAVHESYRHTDFGEVALDLDGELETAPKQDRRVDERYCHLLTMETMDEAVSVASWKAFERHAGLVPAGETLMASAFVMPGGAALDEPLPVPVSAFYIDRHAVTNTQFAKFVQDGGYAQQDWWPAEILPFVLQFVDRTGRPGPRFWNNGQPPAGRERHPVVGICWFEAHAFALWSGQRLPTAAEWQRSATWGTSATSASGARYPWGNAFDPMKANTWRSQHGGTVAVDEYPQGATANGVCQLIGNTWEWTSDPLEDSQQEGEHILFEQTMAEVRGAAFDTYFETQATAQFRTGYPLHARCENIGFRRCISAQDLPAPPDPSALLEIKL